MQSFVRTRIAPTPSGYLHLGNVLSFALTAKLARQTGAAILLRIDDMDRDRVERAYVEDIFDTLTFMGIPWDEGPRDVAEYEREYSQFRRLGLYEQALQRLRDMGKLFACTCSRAQILRGIYPGTCRDKGLPLDTPGCNWRLRTEGAGEMGVKVLGDGRGPEMWGLGGEGFGENALISAGLPVEMTDFVVRKKDGLPAYQLTSVVDDMHFGVDLVVRGADLWASTVAQVYLAQQLGMTKFGEIVFHHHPLLMAPGGEKLSKSAGATSIHYLREQGYASGPVWELIQGSGGVV